MHLLYASIIFIFGLLFGSFYACIGYRIPNKISTIKPNSFCVNCKKELKWYMNIPLFSYIFLKGKCAYCGKKISLMYPIIEILTGILFLISYLYYGFTYNFLISLVIISTFVITCITDLKYFYISDRVIIIGIILILLLNYLSMGTITFIYKLLSGTAMFFLMYLVKIIGDKVFKKESLGGGDIKLMAFVGVCLGFIQSLLVIFMGSILGLIYAMIIYKKNKEGIIPFGPFLLLSTLILWFYNLKLDYLINVFLYK